MQFEAVFFFILKKRVFNFPTKFSFNSEVVGWVSGQFFMEIVLHTLNWCTSAVKMIIINSLSWRKLNWIHKMKLIHGISHFGEKFLRIFERFSSAICFMWDNLISLRFIYLLNLFYIAKEEEEEKKTNISSWNFEYVPSVATSTYVLSLLEMTSGWKHIWINSYTANGRCVLPTQAVFHSFFSRHMRERRSMCT